MRQVPPHRRDVGMVFQNYALFPHMTAAQNVAFPLQMRSVPAARAAAAGRRGARAGEARDVRRSLSAPAVRRPAAADRARPGDRLPAAAAADGRAAGRARQEAPGGAPAGDPAHQPAAQGDRDLRHARPGGGPGDERPDRHLRPRPDPAARAPARTCTSGRARCSSPTSSASRTCFADDSNAMARAPGCSAASWRWRDRPEHCRRSGPARRRPGGARRPTREPARGRGRCATGRRERRSTRP